MPLKRILKLTDDLDSPFTRPGIASLNSSRKEVKYTLGWFGRRKKRQIDSGRRKLDPKTERLLKTSYAGNGGEWIGLVIVTAIVLWGLYMLWKMAPV